MGMVEAGERDHGRREASRADTHGVRLLGWAGDAAAAGVEPVSPTNRPIRKPVGQRMSDSLAAAVGGAVTAVLVFLFS